MRESCISHPARQPMAVVRQDYYLLMNRDCIAAALLNIFEYWANGVIAFNPNEENPWLGVKTTKDFEDMLLGMATDKHIRKRLHQLEEMGFIETRQPVAHRKSLEFRFMVSVVQEALKKANGQTTVESENQRSNDRRVNGQTTVGLSESQRSNDRCTIYKNDLLIKEEKERETPPSPSFEIIDIEVINPPSPNTSALSTIKPDTQVQVQSSLMVDTFPPLAKTEEKIQRYQQLFDNGIMPKRNELVDWANLSIGQYVRLYRKSGFILSSSPNDIRDDFLIEVSKKNCKPGKQPSTDHGFNCVTKAERNPDEWQKLVMWVVEWQASLQTGQEINVASMVASQQRSQQIRQAAAKPFEL